MLACAVTPVRSSVTWPMTATFVVTVLPFAAGMSGWFYLGGALVLGVGFIRHAWKLMDPPDELYAMKVFSYSIVYLMVLFAFLLVDHWLLPWLQPVSPIEFQKVG